LSSCRSYLYLYISAAEGQ
jgi:hypothetical protein